MGRMSSITNIFVHWDVAWLTPLQTARERRRHLILWDESIQFELAASEVLCLTPNLNWARVNRDAIIKSLIENKEQTFRYIVFNNKRPGSDEATKQQNEALRQAEDIIKEAAKYSVIQKKNGLQIMFLMQRSAACVWSTRVGSLPDVKTNDWLYLPLPTDIAVFVETVANLKKRTTDRKTFAVMSVRPIDDKIKAILFERAIRPFGLRVARKRGLYDVRLQDPDHYNTIKDWFEAEWKRYTSSPGGAEG